MSNALTSDKKRFSTLHDKDSQSYLVISCRGLSRVDAAVLSARLEQSGFRILAKHFKRHTGVL
jgi:hypothetical protein